MKLILRLSVIVFLSFFSSYLMAQKTTNNGFIDVTYRVAYKQNYFASGEYNHFIQSQLSDKISFLGEAAFHNPGGWEWVVDVERVIMKYELSDYFKISLGKLNVPIGYWNNAFHHGLVFQPTIERSELSRFEDDRGIFPDNTTGIEFSGSNISKLKLGYDFMIGNGIGSTPISDNNQQKSFCGNVNFEILPDLRIYFSAYKDFVSKGTKTLFDSTLSNNMNFLLGNGSLVYMAPNKPFEFIGEFIHSINTLQSPDSIAKTTEAFSIYTGYKIKRFVPYIRYDQMIYQDRNPFYVDNDMKKVVVGMRYNFNYLSVVKLEYEHLKSEIGGQSNRLTFQFAIGF